jgi:phage replication initiation protein
VHVDLSAGIVSQWDETKLKTVLAWIFAQKGHVTRIDVALDDREASVAVETVRLAVEAGQVVSRSKQFKVIQASNHREGTSALGETLYFGSRESQSMLRVYDKRLELQAKGREDAALYGVRWELEFKQDRAQACAKALLTLDPEDWRAFLVGVLRSYVDFRETTREAESYEKYRAPLVGWWKALTEGFMRCRLVVERIQQRLDDVAAWLANAISPMLAVVVACRGDQFLMEMIYAGTKRWTQKHYALLKQRSEGRPMSLDFITGSWRRMCPGCGAGGCRCKWVKGALYLSCTACDSEFCLAAKSPVAKAGACGSGAWLIRNSLTIQEVSTMQVKAEGAVQGYVERRSREGQGLQIGGFLCEGQRSGGAAIGDSGRSDALDRGLQAGRRQAGESVDRSAEVRTDRTGLLRSVGLEVLK